MHIDWTPLRQELAACRRDAVLVPFWWRDDDAIAPTPDLDKLVPVARDTGLRAHLAVIPAHATPDLAAYMAAHDLIPLVHGWAHQDHSGPDEKKNEFLTDRPDRIADSARGIAQARALFKDALCPVFVPPWNRVHAALLPALVTQGYSGLSTFGARATHQPVPGLTQINTHIDPIWWKGTRDLVAPDVLVDIAATHIRARRQGDEDAAEPLGLLTHHLVHTPAIWAFVHAFINEMLSGGAMPWTTEKT